jgi:hypothetical protein
VAADINDVAKAKASEILFNLLAWYNFCQESAKAIKLQYDTNIQSRELQKQTNDWFNIAEDVAAIQKEIITLNLKEYIKTEQERDYAIDEREDARRRESQERYNDRIDDVNAAGTALIKRTDDENNKRAEMESREKAIQQSEMKIKQLREEINTLDKKINTQLNTILHDISTKQTVKQFQLGDKTYFIEPDKIADRMREGLSEQLANGTFNGESVRETAKNAYIDELTEQLHEDGKNITPEIQKDVDTFSSEKADEYVHSFFNHEQFQELQDNVEQRVEKMIALTTELAELESLNLAQDANDQLAPREADDLSEAANIVNKDEIFNPEVLSELDDDLFGDPSDSDDNQPQPIEINNNFEQIEMLEPNAPPQELDNNAAMLPPEEDQNISYVPQLPGGPSQKFDEAGELHEKPFEQNNGNLNQHPVVKDSKVEAKSSTAKLQSIFGKPSALVQDSDLGQNVKENNESKNQSSPSRAVRPADNRAEENADDYRPRGPGHR